MWKVLLHPEVFKWLQALEKDDQLKVLAAIELLRQDGPSLGRPFVDSMKGSTVKNLKELRITATKSRRFRMLFAFDSDRAAVVLIAGDKTNNWVDFYKRAIPICEQRWKEWTDGKN